VLRRRLGRLDGAIDDLSAALRAKPSRLGARMELLVALRAAGRSEDAAPHAALVLQDAEPLLVDAAEALGLAHALDPKRLTADAVIEEALRAMRGNRSSLTVTWFDRRGALRVLPPRPTADPGARPTLPR
jgi:hypothetical protein